MRDVIRFNFEDDEGNEIKAELPAHLEVCGRCEGHGTHLTPSIGEHAYSREEFEEAFSDDEDKEQYFKRGGIYDVTCEECGGRNVVLEVDEERCDPALLKRYYARLEAEAEDRRCSKMERDFGC